MLTSTAMSSILGAGYICRNKLFTKTETSLKVKSHW